MVILVIDKITLEGYYANNINVFTMLSKEINKQSFSANIPQSGISSNKKIKKHKRKKTRLEDLPLSSDSQVRINEITKVLARQIDKETFNKKTASAAAVLKLVGCGIFLAGSIIVPNLPLILKPFLKNDKDYEVWKRFNIPYLKRTLKRLEKEKLVEIDEENGVQTVKITTGGKRRILKYVLDELAIEKPKVWDGKWRMVSYDIPSKYQSVRRVFRDYLRAWGFYPLHESNYLHAYPCIKQIEFLREYLGVGEYVRIFMVSKTENDEPFKQFFGV